MPRVMQKEHDAERARVMQKEHDAEKTRLMLKCHRCRKSTMWQIRHSCRFATELRISNECGRKSTDSVCGEIVAEVRPNDGRIMAESVWQIPAESVYGKRRGKIPFYPSAPSPHDPEHGPDKRAAISRIAPVEHHAK